MPINVAHNAPASTIAGAAYVGGLGDYQRFMLQKRLQEAQLQQQALNSDRSFAANIRGQNLDAVRDGIRIIQQQRQFEANQQLAADRIAQDREAVLAQNQRAQMAQEAMNARADANMEAAGDRLLIGNFQKWSADHGEQVQGLTKRGFMLTDQRGYDKAMMDMQAILQDRNLLPPARAAKIAELQGRVDRMIATAVPNPQGPPVPPQQDFEMSRATGEDGSTWIKDQNGVWDQKGDPAPPDPTVVSDRGEREFIKDYKATLIVEQDTPTGKKTRPMTIAEARKEYRKWVDQNLRDAHIGYDIARREEEEMQRKQEEAQQMAADAAEEEMARQASMEFLRQTGQMPPIKPRTAGVPKPGEIYTAPDGTKRRRAG